MVGCGIGRLEGMMFVVIVDLAGSVDVRGQCCIFRGGVLSRGLVAAIVCNFWEEVLVSL